ncbi:ferrochelatase [Sneathiella glossodoripedis]|uniref:ferrochelatase n=1 Tax=Sneathiella glossodoripedis TaxID=418853 RepID=UPI0004708C9C|nr:ferrochelatase [Sneathiella glossodoripedis]
MSKKAVILFNLGGPDAPQSVEPFLFNLFNDPAIIGLPNPFRFLVAKLISWRRGPTAREIYAHLGGKSPLLEQTQSQQQALQASLSTDEDEYRVFIAMRYWHPRAEATVREVIAYDPEEVILLPLYPQFSTTTTASSVKEWHEQAKKQGLKAVHSTICCYPAEDGFAKAYAALISDKLSQMKDVNPKLLFSAHGLPKKIVDAGDPYPDQVEKSVAAIIARLNRPDLSHQVCYQSRVGPLEWIGPDTEEEIRKAGSEGQPLLVIPVAFVSEHSETLVELDIEYGELAKEAGVPRYERVPTVTINEKFVEALANLVRKRQSGQIASNEAKLSVLRGQEDVFAGNILLRGVQR